MLYPQKRAAKHRSWGRKSWCEAPLLGSEAFADRRWCEAPLVGLVGPADRKRESGGVPEIYDTNVFRNFQLPPVLASIQLI